MKLNSPWKALLWEELMVGGSIVGTVLAVCAFVSFSKIIFFPKVIYDWQDVDIICYLLGYFVTLLLLLQKKNSGDMHIDIPNRILQLPVNTSTIVTVSLLTRLCLIVVFTVLSRIIIVTILSLFFTVSDPQLYHSIERFREIFPLEVGFVLPLIFPALVHTFVFLTVQFLCWLYLYSDILAGAYILFLILLVALVKQIIKEDFLIPLFSLLIGGLSIGVYDNPLASKGYIFFCILVLFLYGFVIWYFSVRITSRIRSGGRKHFKELLQKHEYLPSFTPNMIIEKFPNIMSAQIWFELRDKGLIIPVWTLIFWLSLSIFYLLFYLLFGYYISYLQYPKAVLLVFPYLSFLLSGIVWYLKVTKPLKKRFKSGIFQLSHIPISRKQRVYSYWITGNINLFITLPILWFVSFIYFYRLFNRFVVPSKFQDLLDKISFQLPFPDIYSFLFPLVIFVSLITITSGLIVWLIMFNPSSIFVFSLLFLYLVYPAHYLFDSSSIDFSFLIGFVFTYFLLMFFVSYWMFNRARLLEKKERILLLIIFFLLFVFILPWHIIGKVNLTLLLIVCLFLSAIITTSWMKTLLGIYGLNWRSLFKNFSKLLYLSSSKEENVPLLFAGYIIPIVFAVFILLSRIQDTQTKYGDYLRKESMPASLAEMNERYHSIPPEKNLSQKYNELIPLHTSVFNKERVLIEEFSKRVGIPEDIKLDRYLSLDFSFDKLKNEKPVPEVIYQFWKESREKIYKDFLEGLHKVAESGLEEGAYPIDLTQGYNMELPHLVRIRNFTRILAVESILNLIDGDYDGMVRDFHTIASICKSLKNEPVYISQLVRQSILQSYYFKTLVWILCHKELPEDVLLELSRITQRDFFIPLEKRPIFKDSLHTELLAYFPYFSQIVIYEYIDKFSRKLNLNEVITIIGEGFYPKDINTMIALNLNTILSKTTTEVAQKENIDILDKQFFDSYFELLFDYKPCNPFFSDTPPRWLYLPANIIYPGLKRIVEIELRYHILVDIIQTALAVERFRLKHNRLPNDLSELVPEYLPEVPKDPFNNRLPLKYIKGEDFAFKVYSIGENQKDDGGIWKSYRRKKGEPWGDDISFIVTSLLLRQSPLISSDISLLSTLNE